MKDEGGKKKEGGAETMGNMSLHVSSPSRAGLTDRVPLLACPAVPGRLPSKARLGKPAVAPSKRTEDGDFHPSSFIPPPSSRTIKTAKSAGVMPLMRPACAKSSGRTRENFSRASARKCSTR